MFVCVFVCVFAQSADKEAAGSAAGEGGGVKKNTSALEREHDKGQYHQTQTRNSCSHYISVIIQQNQTPHSVDYMYYMYMYILHVHVCGLLVEEFP